jgi:hypothetical protein|tara:strand:- start:6708 stop:7052 length:345 start_codon:yes stop_codon:yes gene_type:complete
MKKTIIRAVETVEINGKKYRARIDTGAKRSSINKSLVKKLNLGPISGKIQVKSSNGIAMRPLIKIEFRLKDKKISSEFTVTDRSHMQYSILIGRNSLRKGFLIDPSKKKFKTQK